MFRPIVHPRTHTQNHEPNSAQLLADLAAGHAGNQQRLREAGALEALVAALPRYLSQDALDAGVLCYLCGMYG